MSTLIVDSTGANACTSTPFSIESECTLTGTAPWHALVTEYYGRQADYALKIGKLNNPAGCTAISDPTTFDFDGPNIAGSIASAGEVDCFSFVKWSLSDPTPYLIKAGGSGGLLDPIVTVYDSAGVLRCTAPRTLAQLDGCDLLGLGQYTVVVRDSARKASGTYNISAKRLDSAAGCSALASVAVDAEPVATSIATAGEVDCFEIPDLNAFERVQVGFSATKTTATWAIVNQAGEIVCKERAVQFCEIGGGY